MKHLLLLFLRAVVSSNKQELQCAPGSYVFTPRIGPDICRWCTEGVNFIPRYPEFWHSNRTCFNCTQVRDKNLEVLLSPCNRTHDAEILCRVEYYRYKARNVREKDTCVECSNCENIALQCQGYHDHVCCLPSYEAVWNKHRFYECKERPIVCGSGEFLSSKTEQCTPCPPGTFMMSDKHNQTNCQVCPTLDDVAANHEILQPCNQTHPTIFGCKEGYYKFVSETTEEKVSLCQPCTKCSDQQYEVRKCDRFKGTVCCDSTEMIDQGTHQGPPFLSVSLPDSISNKRRKNKQEYKYIPKCGVGEYLQINRTTNQTRCLPCMSSLCDLSTTPPRDTRHNTDATGLPKNTVLLLSIGGPVLTVFFIIICLVLLRRLKIFLMNKYKREKRRQNESNNPRRSSVGSSMITDLEETDTETPNLSLSQEIGQKDVFISHDAAD